MRVIARDRVAIVRRKEVLFFLASFLWNVLLNTTLCTWIQRISARFDGARERSVRCNPKERKERGKENEAPAWYIYRSLRLGLQRYLRAQSCDASRGKIFANSAVVHLFGRFSQKKSCSAAAFGVNRLSGLNVSSPSIKSKKSSMHLIRGGAERYIHTEEVSTTEINIRGWQGLNQARPWT